MKKKFAVPIGILIFFLTFFFPSEKDHLDKQMAELCKADGGIRVYETVALPPEMFDRWGDPFPNWRQKKSRIDWVQIIAISQRLFISSMVTL